MTNSQAVTHESWLVRCSLGAPGFIREQSARPRSSVQHAESIVQDSDSSVQVLRPESSNSGKVKIYVYVRDIFFYARDIFY